VAGKEKRKQRHLVQRSDHATTPPRGWRGVIDASHTTATSTTVRHNKGNPKSRVRSAQRQTPRVLQKEAAAYANRILTMNPIHLTEPQRTDRVVINKGRECGSTGSEILQPVCLSSMVKLSAALSRFAALFAGQREAIQN